MSEKIRVNGADLDNTNPMPSLEANPNKATYAISILNAAPISVNYILAVIEAGITKTIRLRRITIANTGSVTAAQKTVLSILRTTAASASGVLSVPSLYDSADVAFSGIARITNPTITAGGVLFQTSFYTPAAIGSFSPVVIDFTGSFMKPITISAGVINGAALRIDNGAAGYTNLDLVLEFTEE